MPTDTWIRLTVFAVIFLIMALWERLWSRRKLSDVRGRRWVDNLGIVFAASAFVRFISPLLPIGAAQLAALHGTGILNGVSLPMAVKWGITVIVLDAVIYFQHVLFHAIPALWRLHMVHHSDLDIDVTTGIRFHPVEILISAGVKVGAVYVLGPPVAAVLLFEIVLNGSAMFNHGNVYMPLGLDRWLRRVVVTPDMHRVHHSVRIREANNNFGFFLSWWDRLFGTYTAQPAGGHDGMTIGLSHMRQPESFLRLLAMPVTHPGGAYPLASGKKPDTEKK